MRNKEDEYTSILSRKRWFTIREATDYMSLSRWTIMGMIKNGKLPAVRVGRAIRLDVRDLDALMESMKKTQDRNETEGITRDGWKSVMWTMGQA